MIRDLPERPFKGQRHSHPEALRQVHHPQVSILLILVYLVVEITTYKSRNGTFREFPVLQKKSEGIREILDGFRSIWVITFFLKKSHDRGGGEWR